MSRKLWLLIAGVVILLLLGVAAISAFFFLWPQYRAGQNLALAKEAAAANRVGEAKRLFKEYLYINPNDVEVLQTYANLCLSQLDNRRRNLTEAAQAYYSLMEKAPSRKEPRDKLMAFYRQHQFWDDLDSLAASALKAEPGRHEVLYLQAVAIHEQGRTNDAIEKFEAYLEDGDAPRQDIPLRLARILRGQEQTARAVALLEGEIEAHPGDPVVAANYANYLIDNGDIDEAAALLPESVDSAEADMHVVMAVLRLKSRQELHEEVLALSKEAIAREPERSDLHLNYLGALERLGRREEALEYINGLAPTIRVDAPGIMLFHIEVLLAEGSLEEADKIRETYLSAYPNQAPMDEYLSGRVAFAKNDFETAREHFNMAVEMNPNLQRSRFYLALAQLQIPGEESRQAARVSLELYLRNNPADTMARQLWTREFDRDRSVVQLRIEAKRLLDDDAAQLEYLLVTAQDMLRVGGETDRDWALKLVQHGVAIHPTEARAHLALAGFYLESGELDKVDAVLSEASRHDIDPANFGFLRANMLLLQGDAAGAMAVANETLGDSDVLEAIRWSQSFAQRGYYPAAEQLLDRYIALDNADRSVQDLMLLGIELALQHESLDAALARLAVAEEKLGEGEEARSELNRIRIVIAQRLMMVDKAAADALLEQVRAEDPGHEGLLVLEARELLRATPPDVEAVLAVLEKISEDSYYEDDAEIMVAEVALLRGQYDRARELAVKVTERAPDNRGALHLLADAAMRSGDLNEARTALERALELDSNDERALQVLVNIYSRLQLRRKAETSFERFSELVAGQPGKERLVAELRDFLDLERGNYQDAEARLRERMAANPADYGAVNSLAKSLLQRNQKEEAEAIVRTYIEEQSPSAPEPWVFLGQILLSRGTQTSLGEASSAFTQALLLMPGYAPAQLGNIDSQVRMGNDGVAIALCDRYLAGRLQETDSLSQQDAQVFYQRAALRSRSASGIDAALSDLDQAIAINEAPHYLSLRAALHHRSGKFEDAMTDLRRLNELTGTLEPRDAITMAEALFETGDLAGAERHLRLADAGASNRSTGIAGRIEALEKALKERAEQ